jgi:putative redox protein
MLADRLVLWHLRRGGAEMVAEKQVVARIEGSAPFATQVNFGDRVMLVDEPPSVGGGGAGPTPYQLLSAALAACTSMTLRLYARGKAWTLPEFEVVVTHSIVAGSPARDRFDRRIAFQSPVAADRLARLIDMADRCPVHRTLARTSEVVTSADNGPAAAESPGEHLRQMEEACAEPAGDCGG